MVHSNPNQIYFNQIYYRFKMTSYFNVIILSQLVRSSRLLMQFTINLLMQNGIKWIDTNRWSERGMDLVICFVITHFQIRFMNA